MFAWLMLLVAAVGRTSVANRFSPMARVAPALPATRLHSGFQRLRKQMNNQSHTFGRGSPLINMAVESAVIDPSEVPSIKLNDGRMHPVIGYGTYKVGVVPASASSAVASGSTATDAVDTAECVKTALGLGYRFLDCAEFYANEKAVGEGIAKSGVPRSELFLASKVWTTTIHAGPEAVQKQIEKTLADLGTDYLDFYAIHWPVPGKHVDAYRQLEKARAAGQIRSIGVSNYAVEDFEELMASGATVTPAVNQIEINPFLYRKQTIDFFTSRGVVMQSYRTLRDGKAFDDPAIVGIAAKHGRSAAQILGRWCVQKGFVCIPKSTKSERMAENLMIFDFTLDEVDVAALDALTTPAALEAFLGLYRKCVVRDTPLSVDEAKATITVG